MERTTDVDWSVQVLDQLTFGWESIARPRLEGLTDDEYRWEPVAGCWSIRPRAESTTTMAAGGGDLVIDFEVPEPVPAPVTTIAWRLGHVIVGVFGARNASHFGGPAIDYFTFRYAGDAATALAQLDEGYERWVGGVRSLGPDGLARPCGEAEGEWANSPMATLVLHIHREVIHHLAEVALLRDLYAHRASLRP